MASGDRCALTVTGRDTEHEGGGGGAPRWPPTSPYGGFSVEGLPSSRPRAKPNTNLVKEKAEPVRAELVNSLSLLIVKCMSSEKSFLLRFS